MCSLREKAHLCTTTHSVSPATFSEALGQCISPSLHKQTMNERTSCMETRGVGFLWGKPSEMHPFSERRRTETLRRRGQRKKGVSMAAGPAGPCVEPWVRGEACFSEPVGPTGTKEIRWAPPRAWLKRWKECSLPGGSHLPCADHSRRLSPRSSAHRRVRRRERGEALPAESACWPAPHPAGRSQPLWPPLPWAAADTSVPG